MVSRLKFHYWNVVVVLALVLCETLVESQYYLEEEAPASRPLYLYNSDLGARAQPFLPTEEGRAFSGRTGSAQNDEEENPGRYFAARRGQVESAESDEEDDDSSQEDDVPARSSKVPVSHPPGRSRPVHLPPGFDDKVRKRMRYNKKTKTPLHGDPDPIDEEDDDGRKPESRLLWPFSIEITKGSKGGSPGGYGSFAHHDHPPHHFNEPPPGYPLPPDHIDHHDHPPYHDNDKEYDPDDDPEVQKLRVELFKMKKRTKKWKKIVKYNLAEIGAQIVTKVIEFLEFI